MLHSAASLILMRNQPGGPPEILICQRSAALSFAAGAYVFPGGRVEEADLVLAKTMLDNAGEDDAARIAALRETFEETGIGESLSNGVPWLDPASLISFARWLPPETTKRRFDTRFFISAFSRPDDPVADGREMVSCFWATARDVLDRIASGNGHALFPTRCILERLASFGSFEDAAVQARGLPDRIITPSLEQRGDGAWLCIPEDAGYPFTAERIGSAVRS